MFEPWMLLPSLIFGSISFVIATNFFKRLDTLPCILLSSAGVGVGVAIAITLALYFESFILVAIIIGLIFLSILVVLIMNRLSK